MACYKYLAGMFTCPVAFAHALSACANIYAEISEQKMECKSAATEYRENTERLNEDEHFFGSHMFAPSRSILRKIKSENHSEARADPSWELSLERIVTRFKQDGNEFVICFL